MLTGANCTHVSRSWWQRWCGWRRNGYLHGDWMRRLMTNELAVRVQMIRAYLREIYGFWSIRGIARW